MADLVGQQFGNYILTRLLGRGGFAEVYLGEHIHLATQVAIKILRERPDDEALKDFQREAQIVAHLKHPNIVRVFDYGLDASKFPFLVMDYLPNGSILTIHPRGQTVPLKSVGSYIKQIASALQYAHDTKVIHRDVKPENLLIGLHQEVLLSDFGIAVMAHSTASMTTQNARGTIHYMAPEHCKGHPQPASDQYSLAVVVYEWLCGTLPFKGTFFEIFNNQLYALPPPLQSNVPTIPPDVEKIVLKALAKDPTQRFPSIRDFATAFEQAVSAVPHSFDQSASLTGQTSPPVSPYSPTEYGRQIVPVSQSPVSLASQPPLAIPQSQVTLSIPSPVNTTLRVLPTEPMQQPTILSTPRTKWNPEDPSLFLLGAYGICGISWVAFDIIMFIVGNNLFASGDAVYIDIILLPSSIVLFFSWGWLMAQNTGGVYAGPICRSIGIAAITIFGGPIFWGITLYRTGYTSGGYAPFLIGNAIFGVIFGIIIAIPILLLSIAIGFGANFLGSLIGNRLSHD